ncbi:hypothetical protein C6P44_000464 [Monosporozyma unispora]|nr:hypothetical protein C6P44_000464 [Kazachstania unispora]
MSNFFRDSSLGFKPRANIFNKFKSKENASTKSPNPEFNNPPGNISLTDDDSDSSITNTLMLISNNSTVTGSQTTQHTADSSIVQGNGKNTFDSSSTPKNNTIKKIIEQTKSHRESTDDDDFEITEVRNVEEQKRNTFLPSNSNYTTGNQISVRHNSIVSPMNEEDSSSSSSNDVLLVAFTNTQKICSNLKQELQAQQSENTKLKVKINTYENDISKINIKVESFKKLLVELEGKSKKLISHKETDDDQIKLLTKEYDISKQKISGYRDDLMSLRALLNTIQANKRESEMELTKKAKEIEYLKRELDDCSGQLSEEKIRNGTLSHELETFKNEIITQLKDLTKLTQHDLIENLLQNKTEVCENISKTVKDVLKQDSNILLERFSETILTLTEKYVLMTV